MFVFGVCAGPNDRFETICAPALEREVLAGNRLISLREQPSIAVAYNSILDQAQDAPDLEGVVLLHDDVALDDDTLLPRLRQLFADGAVGIAGAMGGRGKRRGMSWWTCERAVGVVHDSVGVLRGKVPLPADAETLDGLLLALSPWAARNIRFDTSYPGFHGYDADVCSQVTAAGLRAVVIEMQLVHHTGGPFGSPSSYEDWMRATLRWRSKWTDQGILERLANPVRTRLLPIELRVRPAARRRRDEIRTRQQPSMPERAQEAGC